MEDREAERLMLEASTPDAKSTTSIGRFSAAEETTLWKDPRKKTPEERAADEARYEDQMRRLKAMIEKYERIDAERRATETG
jgi:hypothetical protein